MTEQKEYSITKPSNSENSKIASGQIKLSDLDDYIFKEENIKYQSER